MFYLSNSHGIYMYDQHKNTLHLWGESTVELKYIGKYHNVLLEWKKEEKKTNMSRQE